MKRSSWFILMLLGAAPLGRAGAQVSEAPQFHVERMHVPGRILSVHPQDLDGNGRRDIIVIWVSGNPGATKRHIALFFDRVDRGNGFHESPDQDIAVPTGASFLSVADLDSDGKRELVLGNSHGLSALAFDAQGNYGAPRPFATVEGVVLPPDEESLPYLDVARDWGGDGRIEFLLPLLEGIAVVTRGADGRWSMTSELELPPRPGYLVRDDLYEPRARNFSLRIALTVPEMTLGDFDGDGRRDLIAVVDDLVTVFRGEPKGGLFAVMPIARIHLGVRTSAEAARGNALVQVSVLDFDGDGIVDLMVNKVVGGLQSMHAQTGFYLGRKGGGFDRPLQVMARDGFAGSLSFADVDGDRRPDLIMPYTHIGFAEAARILLTRRLSVGFEVHRNLGPKGFNTNADVVRPVDFPVDYSAGAEIDAPLPTLDGDFNGDGVVDFAAGKPPDTLGVWLGGGKQLVAEYPKALVHVPSSRYWQVLDLDGDRYSDILLFYRHRPALEGQLAVLRNTRRGW